MGRIPRTPVFVCLCLVAVSGAAWAQAPEPPGPKIEITITDELVLPPGGDRLAVRDTSGSLISRPGDVILYTLTAANRGDGPAHGVELIDPIPEGTEYVVGSVTGAEMAVSYSIDGGHFYQDAPVTYETTRSDGAIERRPAPASMYTHVKWRVERAIPPGGRVVASLRVRVTARATAEEEPR